MARSNRKSVSISRQLGRLFREIGTRRAELVLACVAALLFGLALGGLLFGKKSDEDAAGTVTPQLFAELVMDAFPEAYPRHMRVVFDRRSGNELIPAEARFFVADNAFAPEFVSARRTEPSASPPTINSLSFQSRYEKILGRLLSPDTVRCQDYHIGRAQTLRDPDWTAQKVREVVLELNVGCQ